MKKLIVIFAAMLFMAGIAIAGPPSNTTAVRLNDHQMDHVTAGFSPAPSMDEALALVTAVVLTAPRGQPVTLPPLVPY